MAGLGAWNLARAALIILLLPRSECGQERGCRGEGGAQGEMLGVEEGGISQHCHSAPGTPRESQKNQLGHRCGVARLPCIDLCRQTTTSKEK